MTSREQAIIRSLCEQDARSSSEIHAALLQASDTVSLVTVKRLLAAMAKQDFIRSIGSGRSTVHRITVLGRLLADMDAHAYCVRDPDERFGNTRYNFELFPGMPADIFSSSEHKMLEEATAEYFRRTTDIPPAIARKELERLIIELSWKSSKIEGNTYTLLDTEKLILENRAAPGHSRQETQMILNHKEAFTFVREHADRFRSPQQADIEALHTILIKDLGVGSGLRRRPVGITGSRYQPLDNIHQLHEGMEALLGAITRMTTPYAKALIALLGLSYLQPFEDGNKRSARLLGNAVLLAYGCAPLSYRSVEENAYREATLVFYEINSLVPMKHIFIDQYDFAARNYAVR